MRIIKYSTEHLVCYEAKNNWQIFEKGNPNEPICIYISMSEMHFSNRILLDEENYKYFMELGEIIKFLYDFGERND